MHLNSLPPPDVLPGRSWCTYSPAPSRYASTRSKALKIEFGNSSNIFWVIRWICFFNSAVFLYNLLGLHTWTLIALYVHHQNSDPVNTKLRLKHKITSSLETLGHILGNNMDMCFNSVVILGLHTWTLIALYVQHQYNDPVNTKLRLRHTQNIF